MYPNPGAERMQLQLKGIDLDQQIQTQILDINGREVQRFACRGESSLEVDMRSHAAGVYWVSVHWKDGLLQRKWVKITP